MSRRRVVLVVDDDPPVAEAHGMLLESLGHTARMETDPEKVEGILVRHPDVELVLLDIRMPRLSGLELLKRIRLKRPQAGVIMATVVNDIELAVEAIKTGAYNYLLKPLQPERLDQVLESYFANQPRNLADDPRFSGFITGCKTFEGIFRAVKSFAEADVTMLLQGETGTGKEIIAEIIHALSSRSGGRFLAVNMGAISESLFEAELFGSRRGAYTGALVEHAGYFEAAGSGTLFLDEIGELSPEPQKKLLRVLQTRRYCRVGETQERELEARLILATNRDLKQEVTMNRFRSDLYYRLAGHVIELPPLRERRGDVTLLAEYLLKKYCCQFGRTLQGFAPETLQRLELYSFPGNVRELEGIISGAVLLETGPRISPESLPHHVQLATPGQGEDLESLRYRAIAAALAACDGNQTRAAQKLGVSRGHLNRLIRQFRSKGTV